MTDVKAIAPNEVVEARKASMPDVVLETFNAHIAQKFNDSSAVVYQDAVVKDLVKAGLKREEIFRMGWLDIEDIYREQGWKVSYDKPGWNENYEAHFEFSVK